MPREFFARTAMIANRSCGFSYSVVRSEISPTLPRRAWGICATAECGNVLGRSHIRARLVPGRTKNAQLPSQISLPKSWGRSRGATPTGKSKQPFLVFPVFPKTSTKKFKTKVDSSLQSPKKDKADWRRLSALGRSQVRASAPTPPPRNAAPSVGIRLWERCSSKSAQGAVRIHMASMEAECFPSLASPVFSAAKSQRAPSALGAGKKWAHHMLPIRKPA